MPGISIVYITFPDEASAKDIGQFLVKEKLVACFNYFPIQSLYTWEGLPALEGEVVAILKTRPALVQKVKMTVSSRHPYKIPCILDSVWEANQAYFDWVMASTSEF